MITVIAGILAVFVIAAVVYLVKVNRKEKRENPEHDFSKTIDPSCCGAHEICDFDQIMMDETIIEYYDDEELDAYKNIGGNGYTDAQIDEFREVLFTLKTQEIRHWLLSLERRKIDLPTNLHEEARMLMAEG